MTSSQARAVLRRDVLHLYTACLRSARRCPAWEQRQIMKIYVRDRFRDDMHLRDESRIRSLLTEGRDELERMDYYHSVYEAKQQAKESSAVGGNDDTSDNTTSDTSRCASCGTIFTPPNAKFCSNCGTKRAA